ncbi:MAG: S8 family peptidase, partial [Ilumatobacteraceae bacterium]
MLRPGLGARLAASVLALAALTVGAAVADGAETARTPIVLAGPTDGSTTDQIIVTFDRPGRRLGTSDLAAVGVSSVRAFGTAGQVVRLPAPRGGTELDAVMRRLAERPGVVQVEPDLRMFPTTSPDDPSYPTQWNLTDPASSGVQGIDVEAAWAISTGNQAIRVAVLDTGYTDHPDLDSRIVGGYEFITEPLVANDGNGRDADAHDPGDWITSTESRRGLLAGCPTSQSSWHGTHVAGTIGAATGNATGIAGINQVSQLVPVRVLGKCGGYGSDIADAIRWSAGLFVSGVPTNPHPAKVINMSLGGSGTCAGTAYQDAISAAVAAGAVVVVAAGNGASDAAGFTPASCAGVVTVGSTGKAGGRAYYSNFGVTVEVSAPGGDSNVDMYRDTILSTINSGTRSPGSPTYAKYQGTSMAAPHVAGIASLILSVDPTLSPADVTGILQSTARPFPNGSSCLNNVSRYCGTGIVDAGAAVSAAAGGSGPTTTTSTTTTTTVPSTSTSTTSTTTSTTSTTTSTTTTQPGSVPGTFFKLSPANGATRLRSVTLSWSGSTGAVGYEVCVDSRLDRTCDGAWTPISGTSAGTSRLRRS